MEIKDSRVKELGNLYGDSSVRRFLSVVTDYLDDHAVYPGLRDEVENVRANYERMMQCYRQGMPDPKREDIFYNIEDFMYKVWMNLVMNDHILSNQTLQAAKKRGEKLDLASLGEALPLHKDDAEFYNVVFSALLTSWQWDSSMSFSMVKLVISPEIDPKLAALMVSAIMLSCLCTFDFYKFECLVNIYRVSANVMVKERAFVGWVFCSCKPSGCCLQQVSDVLVKVLDDITLKKVCELQKQIIFCMDADKDSDAIDKDIISKISNGKLSRPWMKDNDLDDTPLSEILHPELEEEQAEKLEQSMLAMSKMQKQGSDIYFGGFSKMKKFGFFHRMSNWFVPFYVANPALQSLLKRLDGDETFLKSIETSSPFCESDKYSFAFGVEMTLKSDFDMLKPLIKEGFMFSHVEKFKNGLDKGTFVRRMYLQDLYRFFRLSPFGEAFENPFSGEDESCAYFLRCWSFDDDTILRDVRLKLCRFLAKRKDYKRLGIFVPQLAAQDCSEGILLYAIYLMNYSHSYHEAAMFLAMLTFATKEENAAVLKAMAKCFMELEMYDGAYETYVKLQNIKPSESTRLKIAFCLIKCDKPEEALKILYELNYKHPDNADVIRSLAWAHLLNDNLDGAFDLYGKLKAMADDGSCLRNPDDVYNLGLCYWVKHDFPKAHACFQEYLTTKGGKDADLYENFDKDYNLLEKYGIKYYEVYLMIDSIETKCY